MSAAARVSLIERILQLMVDAQKESGAKPREVVMNSTVKELVQHALREHRYIYEPGGPYVPEQLRGIPVRWIPASRTSARISLHGSKGDVYVVLW